MKMRPLLLWLILLLPGCSTVASYEAKLPAGPAKPEDYPIYIYPENMEVPRPAEVIGTVHVGDTLFTVMGGSIESVMKQLQQTARRKGADAIKLTAIKTPGFASPRFGADANLLRFTSPWETISLSEDQLVTYYKAQGTTLDPIEGIWTGDDPTESRIGIMKNQSQPRRDFVAFILSTKNPAWPPGEKKMDLRRGERPGVYRGNYYRDNYQETSLAFTLRGSTASTFIIQISDDSKPVTFTRE